jgi:hypothetical protein
MKKLWNSREELRKGSNHDWRWKIDFRLVLGAILISASLFSAYVISQSTSRMVTVWSAANDLAPGEIVEESDLVSTKVALANKAELYLDGNLSIVGTTVVRPISASELIPAFSISQNPLSNLTRVPISLPSLRIPNGVASGSVVDLFGILRSSISNSNVENVEEVTKLIITRISVDSMNMESSKLGGEIGVTLLVPEEEVARFISNIARYELILVKTQ